MRSLLLIIIACTALAGCKKLFRTEDKYAIFRGRLVKDCSLEPVAGATIGFLTEKPNSTILRPPVIAQVGETITDADGRFEIQLNTSDISPMFISCKVAGGNVTASFMTPYQWKVGRKSENTHDMGNVYVKQVPVYVNVVANIGRRLRAKDSLIISYKGRPVIYSPVPAQNPHKRSGLQQKWPGKRRW